MGTTEAANRQNKRERKEEEEEMLTPGDDALDSITSWAKVKILRRWSLYRVTVRCRRTVGVAAYMFHFNTRY